MDDHRPMTVNIQQLVINDEKSQSSCKKWALNILFYFITFCIGFAIALGGIIAIYAGLKKEDVHLILPEECYIKCLFKYPLALPPSPNENDVNDFVAYDNQLVFVTLSNHQFEHHQQMRQSTFSGEPLKYIAILYATITAISFIVFFLQYLKKGFLCLTTLAAGIQCFFFLFFVISFIKYNNDTVCDQAFWYY